MVKSPISRPLGDSIGVSDRRPTCGTRPAMMRSSQARAPAPLTRYLPKLWTSLMPTFSRTAFTSRAVASKAFERRKEGVSYRGSSPAAK